MMVTKRRSGAVWRRMGRGGYKLDRHARRIMQLLRFIRRCVRPC